MDKSKQQHFHTAAASRSPTSVNFLFAFSTLSLLRSGCHFLLGTNGV